MKIMKWCCVVFKSWYEAAGERGISILVGRNSVGKPEFLIQQRAIDNDITEFPNTNYPISLVSDVCISYCPWCGQDLAKWYGKNTDALYRPNLKVNEQ